jgi:hypothetical protein
MPQDALGGNSRTVLIVNVHSDAGKLEHIARSLQFAADVKDIRNTVRPRLAAQRLAALGSACDAGWGLPGGWSVRMHAPGSEGGPWRTRLHGRALAHAAAHRACALAPCCRWWPTA